MKLGLCAVILLVTSISHSESHSDVGKEKRKPSSQIETIDVGPDIKATLYFYKQSRGITEILTVLEDSKNNSVCYLRNDRGGISCVKK